VWSPWRGMKDLGTLSGRFSGAEAINDRGEVTGFADTAGGAASHAFVWSPWRGMKDLGTLGGTFSGAAAINDRGEVTGGADTTGADPAGDPVVHAFVWSPWRGMKDLGTLGGTDSYTVGINDRGEVTGNSDIAGAGAQHAFVWTASLRMKGPLSGNSDSATPIDATSASPGAPTGKASRLARSCEIDSRALDDGRSAIIVPSGLCVDPPDPPLAANPLPATSRFPGMIPPAPTPHRSRGIGP